MYTCKRCGTTMPDGMKACSICNRPVEIPLPPIIDMEPEVVKIPKASVNVAVVKKPEVKKAKKK
jgi:hypothetical protein